MQPATTFRRWGFPSLAVGAEVLIPCTADAEVSPSTGTEAGPARAVFCGQHPRMTTVVPPSDEPVPPRLLRASQGPSACRGHRRGQDWINVSYGLHRPAHQPAGLHTDLLAWRLVLPPSGAFTHLTAAAVHGLWLPPLPPNLPIFASMSRDESRRQRVGLRIVRLASAPDRVILEGVPVTPVTETILACAVHLRLLDLVVLCDAALHLRLCTREELEAVAALQRRGAPMLRRALRYADARSESAWETLLRILHVLCRIPVEPQAIITAPDGTFVAQGDLLILGTRTLHEYDGGDHLPRPRQRKDLKRNRRLDRIDYTRRGYTSQDVLHQAVGILRDADASLGRPHRPERIRKWHALLADSLFTPSGTQRFLDRLGPSADQKPGLSADQRDVSGYEQGSRESRRRSSSDRVACTCPGSSTRVCPR